MKRTVFINSISRIWCKLYRYLDVVVYHLTAYICIDSDENRIPVYFIEYSYWFYFYWVCFLVYYFRGPKIMELHNIDLAYTQILRHFRTPSLCLVINSFLFSVYQLSISPPAVFMALHSVPWYLIFITINRQWTQWWNMSTCFVKLGLILYVYQEALRERRSLLHLIRRMWNCLPRREKAAPKCFAMYLVSMPKLYWTFHDITTRFPKRS